jgi:RecB family exonuclease
MGFSWSNSNISMLMRCPEQFRRAVIEGERRQGTAEQHRGTAVHAVAAEAHTRQLKAKSYGADTQSELAMVLPSIEEARDLAATEFDRVVGSEGVRLLPDESGNPSVIIGGFKDAAVDLSGFYVKEVAPNVDPVAVEHKVIVKPRDSDIVISGIMDLVSEEPGGKRRIRDVKTGDKTPPGNTADRSPQLDMYAMLHKVETGKLPDGVTLDHVVRTPKMAQMKHVRLDSVRTEADITALVERINIAVETVKRGAFMPNTNGWHCDRRYCYFFDSCKYVSSRIKG